jgi:DMSO/TMAO reductase YedYZ heme-binding membrane subunit
VSLPLLSLASLVLGGMAVATGAMTAALALVFRKTTSSSAWVASVAGSFGLLATVMVRSTQVLDLATAMAVVLIRGVGGAGWAPPGRRVLLMLGSLYLLAGSLAPVGTLWDASVTATGADGGTIFTLPQQLTWAVARSSGLVAFLAAMGAVILRTRRQSGLPIGGLPSRVYALHRALGIASVLAVAVHLVALWADNFVEFTASQLLLVLWTSSYEPFAVTLGWLVMIALLLAAASGGLRRLLPGWRVVHALAFLIFPLGLVHGLLAGSDSGSLLALAFYLATLLAMVWAVYRRLFSSSPPSCHDRKKTMLSTPSARADATAREGEAEAASRARRVHSGGR